MDLNHGNLLQQLGINRDGSFMFISQYCITVKQSERKIFVTDSNSITCLTTTGTIYYSVIYRYRDDGMQMPMGIYCDDGIVCGERSNNVQVITAAGNNHCELISSKDGVKWPTIPAGT